MAKGTIWKVTVVDGHVFPGFGNRHGMRAPMSLPEAPGRPRIYFSTYLHQWKESHIRGVHPAHTHLHLQLTFNNTFITFWSRPFTETHRDHLTLPFACGFAAACISAQAPIFAFYACLISSAYQHISHPQSGQNYVRDYVSRLLVLHRCPPYKPLAPVVFIGAGCFH